MPDVSCLFTSEVHIPPVGHSDPHLLWQVLKGRLVTKMIIDKLYWVDIFAELRDCWLPCYAIYFPNLTVKGGAHILHNLNTCKCNIFYFHIFTKKPKSCRFFMIFFLLVFFVSNLVKKTFFCLNTFQLSESSFVRKILDDLPQCIVC